MRAALLAATLLAAPASGADTPDFPAHLVDIHHTAEQGDADKQIELGMLHRRGDGVPQDNEGTRRTAPDSAR